MTNRLPTLAGVLALAALAAPAQASAMAGGRVRCDLAPSRGPVAATAYAPAPADSALVALHASGLTFPDFLAAAKARREGWLRLADSAVVSDAIAGRARAFAAAAPGGAWRLLVVAVDSCGDSMNTVPYVAKVADLAGVSLRIVHPRDGRAVQEAHRSLDGRTATPTYVLIDAGGNERGCIVEQPRALREWSSAERAKASIDSVHAGIRAFYAKDQGASMALEVIELLEAAEGGRTVCDRGVAR